MGAGDPRQGPGCLGARLLQSLSRPGRDLWEPRPARKRLPPTPRMPSLRVSRLRPGPRRGRETARPSPARWSSVTFLLLQGSELVPDPGAGEDPHLWTGDGEATLQKSRCGGDTVEASLGAETFPVC